MIIRLVVRPASAGSQHDNHPRKALGRTILRTKPKMVTMNSLIPAKSRAKKSPQAFLAGGDF
jgi:hypothetical protein